MSRVPAAIINPLRTMNATPNTRPPGPPSRTLPAPLVVFAGYGKTVQRTAAVDGTAEGMGRTFRRVYEAAVVRSLGSEGRN